jgi:spore maturation protein CgeB
LRVVIFCHSLLSDWNHGNAHFLRGIVGELQVRGHDVRVYEPYDAWSVQGLLRDGGAAALDAAAASLGAVQPVRYDAATLDVDAAVDSADLVLAHEWNDPALIARLGIARRYANFRLLLHDTHHRAATAPHEMAQFDLRDYDGVLAFGRVIRDIYLERGWAARAWTWHEAADTRRFHPLPRVQRAGDLVWIGNWGDDERTIDLMRYLVLPAARLGLRARVYGVRYPRNAKALLDDAGIEYAGWLPNARVPQVFSSFDVTVHVPRRTYVEQLPGIPTIRVFEALACGIPLVCAPWEDSDALFTAGEDFLTAATGREMELRLRELLADEELRSRVARQGLRTVHERHTCAHRVDELIAILASLDAVVHEGASA